MPIPISVVVVNLNRRALLVECLESLLSQTLPPLEIVLVDNGSVDGSAEAAERAMTGRSVPLRLIRNARNRGFCAANNQGIAIAQGEAVALLNNDAVAAPGWLHALAESLDRDPRVGMVASKILVRQDPARIDKCGHLIYWDGQNRGRGTGEIDRGQYDAEDEVLWPDGCAALYRRAMLDEIGGFDEDYFAYADDAELGLRGRLAGWRCLYTPRAVVYHLRGQTLGVGSVRRLRLIERNRILLVWTHFPWDLVWLNGIYYALRLAAGLWAAVRNQGEIRHFPGWAGKLKAIWALASGNLAAIPLLPGALKKRALWRRLRKLTGPQLKALLRRHRISLHALSEQAN